MIRRFKNKINVLRASPHMPEVIRGAGYALVIRVIAAGFGLLLSLLIARSYGAEGTGVFYLIVGLVVVLATVARFGLDNTVVKYVSSSFSVNDWESVRFVYATAIKMTAVISSVIAVFLFIFAGWMADHAFHNPALETPLTLAAFALLPYSLAMLHAEALRGLKKISDSQFIKTGAVSFGTIAFLFPLAKLYEMNGAIAAYLISIFLTLFFSIWRWRSAIVFATKAADTSPDNVGKPVSFSMIVNSSWPLFGVVFSGLIIQNSMLIMLGLLATARDVGIYTVANQITSIMLFPLMAGVTVLAPKFAELHKNGKNGDIEKIAKQSSMLLCAFVFPAAGIVYAFSQSILSMFGPDFESAVTALHFLLVAVVVNVATGAVAEVLVMTGHERTVRTAHSIGAFVVITGGLLTIPQYGAMGAALASASGFLIINITMVIQVKRQLGFWPIGFGPAKVKTIDDDN